MSNQKEENKQSLSLLRNYIPPKWERTLIDPIEYAGLWLRVKALLIDGFIIGIISEGLRFIFKNVIDSSNWTEFEILIDLGALLMMVLFTNSRYQGTLGKILLNIKVTDLQGNRISFIRSLARYGIYFVSFLIPLGFTHTALSVSDLLPLNNQLTFLKNVDWILISSVMVITFLPLIGLLMIAFTRRKQTLHDKLFNTLVLKCK